MKSLKLNIAERLTAIAIFNNPENKVSTSDLKGYLDDVNKFRITDLDKETVNWKDNKNEAGVVTSVSWNDEQAGPMEIQVDAFTEKFLNDKLDKLQYSAADPLANAVLSLLEKLKN